MSHGNLFGSSSASRDDCGRESPKASRAALSAKISVSRSVPSKSNSTAFILCWVLSFFGVVFVPVMFVVFVFGFGVFVVL